jgi:hypothetical protein
MSGYSLLPETEENIFHPGLTFGSTKLEYIDCHDVEKNILSVDANQWKTNFLEYIDGSNNDSKTSQEHFQECNKTISGGCMKVAKGCGTSEDDKAYTQMNLDGDGMIQIAISVAAHPSHGVNLKPGIPNLANGNCLYEVGNDQLNNRMEFAKFGAGKYDSPKELKISVVSKMQSSATMAHEWGGYEGNMVKWAAKLEKLKMSKDWDCNLGDLMLPGLAVALKKNILIFFTNPKLGNSPICVIAASEFGGEADIDIPIVMAYNGSHYEGLLPINEVDIIRTMELVDEYIQGAYNTTVRDIPILRNQLRNLNMINIHSGEESTLTGTEFTVVKKIGTVTKHINDESEKVFSLKAFLGGKVQCHNCKKNFENMKDHFKVSLICGQTFKSDHNLPKNKVQCIKTKANEIKRPANFSKVRSYECEDQRDTIFENDDASKRRQNVKTCKFKDSLEKVKPITKIKAKSKTKHVKKKSRKQDTKTDLQILSIDQSVTKGTVECETQNIQGSENSLQSKINYGILKPQAANRPKLEVKKEKKKRNIFMKNPMFISSKIEDKKMETILRNNKGFKLMIINKNRCCKCNITHTPYLKFCKWLEEKEKKRLEKKRMENKTLFDLSPSMDKNMKSLISKRIDELETNPTKENQNERKMHLSKKQDQIVSTRIKFPDFSKIFLCMIIFGLIPSVFGSDDFWGPKHFNIYLYGSAVTIILLSWLIWIFIFFCCRWKTEKKNCDIEEDNKLSQPKERKITTSTLFNIHNELEQNSCHFSTDDDTDLQEFNTSPNMFYFYALDIIKEMDKIAECNHRALYIKFDQFENIDQAFLCNKSLKLVQKIDIQDVEKWEFDIENCGTCPMQQNRGKGKKVTANQNLISMKSAAIENTKCSLIAIVLSLFNTKTFKLAMAAISRDLKLCNLASCEFCLLFNLFLRYQTSKRTINPVELQGLGLYNCVDDSSIDITYLRLVKALEESVNSNHPEKLQDFNIFLQNNITVEKHSTCDSDPNIKYNFIENHYKSCMKEKGTNTLCICGDIYSSKIRWSGVKSNRNGYIVIYEKNPQKINIKKDFEVDGHVLKLTSFIDYTNDHFTCCIPDFEKGKIDLLEEEKNN